ncbi:cytochrome P450 [Nocardia blacklockiae]|uniref:cytochrome P450 n=1 Tax=Nocardia blacklockiae TaxID=480036 RepID=UPI001893F68B|nr:cytochrome P450 [Nocardia blacklockiae]MBF6171073.1 cytochrome P450 [Nocardia blacklockiae]
MTTSTPPPSGYRAGDGLPAAAQSREALYHSGFANNMRAALQDLRARFGPLAPVDVTPGTAATLVIGYRDALRVLADPGCSADPRAWQARAQRSCPELAWRPDALHSAGDEHTRLRRAVVTALGQVDQKALRDKAASRAAAWISSFSDVGRADLLGHFAIPVVIDLVHDLLGLPEQAAAQAYRAIMALRGAVGPAEVERGHQMLVEAMEHTVAAKRDAPGRDVTSWLIEATDSLDSGTEPHQLAMLYSMATQPVWNLIANTLLLLMTDDKFGGDMLGGALSIRDGIDEVLFTNPPLATACPRFPTGMKIIADTQVPEREPVLISLAGCHTDPEIENAGGESLRGNRSYLSFGAHLHECPEPAKQIALVIAGTCLDELMDTLPEIALAQPAEQMQWLPGAIHRGLALLPAVFPPMPSHP